MSGKILVQFLILGCLAFGGPIAHLAWFERTFVERLKWLDHEQLAGLIALCQALPGPASSQTAIAIGYLKGGWSGFWLAWLGFSTPPAILMLAAAYGALALPDSFRISLTNGMKVAVVSVIAVALWRMARSLIRDRGQVLAALGYGCVFLAFPNPWMILLLIALIVLIALRRENVSLADSLGKLTRRSSTRWLIAAIPLCFIFLHLIHLLIPGPWSALPIAFYQTGLLVFGGGHVVLPLLESLVVQPGWVSPEAFLFGYGVAQMIPGPLFTFAAFLGAQFPVAESMRLLAGILALAAIYLPSFLLLAILLPRWKAEGPSPQWQSVLRNLHPLVIGLLLATWINPVLTGAVRGPLDILVAVGVTFCLIRFQRFTVLIIFATAGLYLTFSL